MADVYWNPLVPELGGAQLVLEALHPDGWTVGVLERPFGRGIDLQVEVESARAVGSMLVAAGFTLFHGPSESWYDVRDGLEGQLEVLAQDPDGYLSRFVESLGRRPAGGV